MKKTEIYFLILLILALMGSFYQNPMFVIVVFIITWTAGYFERAEQEEERERKELKNGKNFPFYHNQGS